MAEPTAKDLLNKLSGKKIMLSTHCGTFKMRSGVIQQVFDAFFLFITQDERLLDADPTRNWIWMSNIAVLTEESRAGTEDIPVTRYEI